MHAFRLPKCRALAAAFAGLLAAAIGGHADPATGDPANGKTIFMQCQACHSAQQGVNKFGPSLFGVVGRHAGSISDYAYSPAMRAAAAKGLVWTEENIETYLQNPHKFLDDFAGDQSLPNKMPFSLSDPKSRRDVVSYLKSNPGGK